MPKERDGERKRVCNRDAEMIFSLRLHFHDINA